MSGLSPGFPKTFLALPDIRSFFTGHLIEFKVCKTLFILEIF